MADTEATVTITRKQYNSLINDQKVLIALESAGVDNWDGYEFAMENLED